VRIFKLTRDAKEPRDKALEKLKLPALPPRFADMIWLVIVLPDGAG